MEDNIIIDWEMQKPGSSSELANLRKLVEADEFGLDDTIRPKTSRPAIDNQLMNIGSQTKPGNWLMHVKSRPTEDN